MLFHQLNFNQLYRDHLKAANYQPSSAQKWDKKAEKMAKNLAKPSLYVQNLLNAMRIAPNETVLDIGAGAGALAIPLTKQGVNVYALDFSSAMLAQLAQAKARQNLTSLVLIEQSWTDDWENVPCADVVLASRSTLVADLDEMIDKLCAKAKKRVYLTSITQPHFLDARIFQAIGREQLGFPTYIYLLNRLYQRGILANVNFIETESGEFQGETFEELQQSVVFSIGALSAIETQKLREFYADIQRNGEKIRHGQPKWALIWWEV